MNFQEFFKKQIVAFGLVAAFLTVAAVAVMIGDGLVQPLTNWVEGITI